ncbi:MAG: hypothetical protein ACI9MC_004013 [Kiritimatiellia bacterium]|jgi:hypothetical protein
MSRSTLDDRAQALEGKFFREMEHQQLDEFRAKQERKTTIAELAEVTSFTDQTVLEGMADLGVTPLTLAALAIIPMLHVAWSDEVLDLAERKTILLEATSMGIKSSSPAYALLESWLTVAPNPELFECWKTYHAELGPLLSADGRARLRTDILESARRLARASGGLFGVGAVGGSERAALRELETLLA